MMKEVREVYVKDKVLILTTELEPNLASFQRLTLSHDFAGIFNASIDLLIKNPTLREVVITHDKMEEMWIDLTSAIPEIKAAGCLVLNDAGHLLTIYRQGHWDLPKGKIDAGETSAKAALRETKEETGVMDLEQGDFIGRTYHWFERKGNYFIKSSDWYQARFTGKPDFKLVPQTEEDISEVRWMSVKDCLERLPQFFPSIQKILANNFLGSL